MVSKRRNPEISIDVDYMWSSVHFVWRQMGGCFFVFLLLFSSLLPCTGHTIIGTSSLTGNFFDLFSVLACGFLSYRHGDNEMGVAD